MWWLHNHVSISSPTLLCSIWLLSAVLQDACSSSHHHIHILGNKKKEKKKGFSPVVTSSLSKDIPSDCKASFSYFVGHNLGCTQTWLVKKMGSGIFLSTPLPLGYRRSPVRRVGRVGSGGQWAALLQCDSVPPPLLVSVWVTGNGGL